MQSNRVYTTGIIMSHKTAMFNISEIEMEKKCFKQRLSKEGGV